MAPTRETTRVAMEGRGHGDTISGRQVFVRRCCEAGQSRMSPVWLAAVPTTEPTTHPRTSHHPSAEGNNISTLQSDAQVNRPAGKSPLTGHEKATTTNKTDPPRCPRTARGNQPRKLAPTGHSTPCLPRWSADRRTDMKWMGSQISSS